MAAPAIRSTLTLGSPASAVRRYVVDMDDGSTVLPTNANTVTLLNVKTLPNYRDITLKTYGDSAVAAAGYGQVIRDSLSLSGTTLTFALWLSAGVYEVVLDITES